MHYFSDYYDSFEEAKAAADKFIMGIMENERKQIAKNCGAFIDGNWIESATKLTGNLDKWNHTVTKWRIEQDYDGKFYFYAE